MAKRFADTNKYKKPFLRLLPGPYKLLWDFLCLDCDHAGIWIVDFEIAQMYIGPDMQVSKAEALRLFNSDESRVIEIEGGKKWFLPSFIEFQYGNQLVTKNRMHVPIITRLTKYDLFKYVDIEILEEGNSINAYRGRITKKVKDEICLRDQFTCQYCAIQYNYSQLVVDHIVALKNGGTNDYLNLCACCIRCNSHKTDTALDKFLSRKLEFLNPTDFILKHPCISLQAPSNNLEGAMVKDKELDKDREKDMDFGKSENLLDTQGVVPDMCMMFVMKNEEYPTDNMVDFPACRMIAQKIKKWEGLKGDITEPVNTNSICRRWGELVDFIRADQHFSGYSLTQINKHFQSIAQSFSNGRGQPYQQPTPGNSRQQGANQLLDSLRKDLESSAGGGRNL